MLCPPIETSETSGRSGGRLAVGAGEDVFVLQGLAHQRRVDVRAAIAPTRLLMGAPKIPPKMTKGAHPEVAPFIIIRGEETQ